MASEAVTWAALVASVGGLVALATFWMTIGSRIAAAETKAENSILKSTAVELKCEAVSREHNDYRVEMASKISQVKTMIEIQVAALTAAENRLAKSIDDMCERFDRMAERLDRIIERDARS